MQDLFQEKELPEAAPAGVKSVLVPYPVDKAYDYIIPPGLDVQDGDYVTVPLGGAKGGGREVPGVVWGAGAGDVPPEKLKEALERYDMPPMPAVHREFLDWVASYNMAAKGAVLKMALSVPKALEPATPVKAYRLSDDLRAGGLDDLNNPVIKSSSHPVIHSLSPQRKKVLEILQDGTPRRPAEIAELAGVSAGVVTGMADKGLLEVVELHSAAPCRSPDCDRHGPALSDDQQAAAERICAHVRAGEFKVSLLDGVTGAGKTETYFEGVAQALKNNKQVLILLPEIALSNAFLDRFKSRFGCAPALWHSNLTPAQRRVTWRGVAEGEVKVVVGARSALFLPYADLGLIVVDEEHDPAFKQEEGVIYHARDMAVVRASMGKFPIVLVSATPSLETMHNAWNGRYEHLHLPGRFGGAALPDIHMIDLRADKPESGKFLAPSLVQKVAENLEAGEQTLLFLNRRGYAPLTLCRTCGHRMDCPRCTAWLVEHKARGRLECHHCGFMTPIPKSCPSCNDTDSFAACGPGVERIAEEVKAEFPEARVLVLASDTAENQEELSQMIRQVREHEVDIIIGTQIIAKGHHFPQLTLVGVVDADLGLQGGELRGSERVYQLLHQVAGRAGREEKKGRVYLQSYMPDHRIMKALAAGARDGFLEAEAQEREASGMPPYGRLAGIIVSGRDEAQVMEAARALGRSAPQGPGIRTLGPAEAPFYRLRGKYRRRLLVRADKNINIQKSIAAWIAGVKHPSTVRIQVDVDPQSFM